MRLYEIDKEIEELLNGGVDPETGELLIDFDQLSALQMEREAKLEAIALHIKNDTAEADAIAAEMKALDERKKALVNRAQRAKDFLAEQLAGQRFETPRVACTFRNSQKVEITPEFIAWAKLNAPLLLRYKEPEPDKTAIKKAIANGEEAISFASMVPTCTMSIK